MTVIYPTDREDAKSLAQRLLKAAGKERHDEVRTTSDGPLGIAFDVPDDLAEAVLGYEVVDEPDDAGSSPAADGAGDTQQPAAVPAGDETSADAAAGESEASAEAADSSSAPPKAPRSRATRGR